MDYIFDDWKKVLSDFQNSVEKDLAEIHKQKEAVQQMKTDIFERLDNGQYIYDEHRIVLSAPEIIIGHVDRSGDLKDGGKVIIRGTEVDVEGVGEAGSIISRAPIISRVMMRRMLSPDRSPFLVRVVSPFIPIRCWISMPLPPVRCARPLSRPM